MIKTIYKMDKLLAHLPASIKTYYKQPLHVVRGQMQFLWDAQGRKYLDMIGGIVTISVGHCHPCVCQNMALLSAF